MFWIVAITSVGIYANAQTASQTTHTVASGDSLYVIVAEYYPDRLARWTDVAADIVALNPEAFPEGLDSVMGLGDELIMVDYDTPTQSANPAADTQSAPGSPSPAAPSGSYAAPDANLDRVDTTPAQSVDISRRREVAPTAIDNATAPTVTTDQANAASDTNISNLDSTDANGRRVIGRVVASNSAVAIDHNNQQRALDVDDVIYPGDAVTTGPFASVTVTMLDEAEYHLQSSSRLMFERYQYAPETQRGSAVMTLVKGGFNARTGLLGRHQPNAVTVNTAVATVGIRGTEYALRVCASESCRLHESSDYLDAGLYTGVLEGSIVLSNNTGNRESRRGEFLHVAAPNTMPETATEAAGLLFSTAQLTLLNVDIEEEQPLSFLGWLKRKLFGD